MIAGLIESFLFGAQLILISSLSFSLSPGILWTTHCLLMGLGCMGNGQKGERERWALNNGAQSVPKKEKGRKFLGQTERETDRKTLKLDYGQGTGEFMLKKRRNLFTYTNWLYTCTKHVLIYMNVLTVQVYLL